jgi:hypothetical protein
MGGGMDQPDRVAGSSNPMRAIMKREHGHCGDESEHDPSNGL